MEARKKVVLLSYDWFSRLFYSMPVMFLCGQPEFVHFQEYIVYAQQLYGVLYLTTTLKVGFTVCICVRMCDHFATNCKEITEIRKHLEEGEVSHIISSSFISAI
jgi:hypothetical protein